MFTAAVPSTMVSSGQSRRSRVPLEGFLIPGVFGDEPRLRVLRERLQNTFNLDLLTLPDIGSRSSVLASMVATAKMLVDEIANRCPSGPIHLIGYSFGASVALEVAVQLSDVGRDVAFLGVLDGPFEPPKVTLRKKVGFSPMALFRTLESFLMRSLSSKNPILRRTAEVVLSGTTEDYRADATRRAMLWHLRNKALTGWTPRSSAARGLYVSTGHYGPDNRTRWIELCPNLDHVEIPAVHKEMLKTRTLRNIVFHLEAAAKIQCSRRSISAGG